MRQIVGPEEVKFYKTHGYVVLREVLPAEVLARARQVCNEWITLRVEEWFERGLISHCYPELDIEERFMKAWNDAGQPNFDRRRIYYYNIFADMFHLVSSSVFLDVAEQMLGTSELSVSAVSNPRIKHQSLPWATLQWHADVFYWEESATGSPLDFLILWYPLHPVGPGRGSLEVISLEEAKGSQFRIDSKTTTLLPEQLDAYEKVTLELKPGDLLCMCDDVLHRSVPNESDSVIWTVDHRYEHTQHRSRATMQKGLVARSIEQPTSVTSLSEWLSKREPRGYDIEGKL